MDCPENPRPNRLRCHWQSLRRFACDDEGSHLVEFAFVLPVLLTLLLGVVEFSYAMIVDRKVTNTTQALADLVAQREVFNNNALNDIQAATGLMIRPLPPNFTLAIAHVPYRPSDDVPDMSLAAAWKQELFVADPITDADAEALATGLGFGGEAVIIVDFTYDYDSVTGGIFTSLLTMLGAEGRTWDGATFRKRMVSRPREIRQIPCPICP